MTDRDYMENMLLLEKGACDLLMHGAIESSSTDVHQTFATSLGAALRRQEQIYGKMEYSLSGKAMFVPKINEVKMKFAQQSC